MTPPRLRVCHVAYTFYENDNRVMRYAQTMAEQGHDVTVVALRRRGQPARGASHGVRVHRIQRRSVNERGALSYFLKVLWFLLRSALHLTLLQIRHRYDVVHVHNVPDFLVFSAVVPKLMGVPVILDIHDILPELYAGKFGTSDRSLLFRALLLTERLSCRFADHVIVANHLWHRRLVERAVVADRCTPILNYPDLRLFRPDPEVSTGRSGAFVFLYPGTLNRHQGLDLAVDAFALTAERMPGAELHIYGEGPARGALERQVRERGLEGRVRLRNRVPLEDVARLMSESAAGVVPKRADGFGNEAFSTKILEFMACGVPVIVARTAVDAYYFDESLVRFFAPGDVRDLAAAMLWVFEHPAEQAARVRAAQEHAARFSWQERSGDYLTIVARLSAAKPTEAAAA